jgi:hypothetical protein
MLLFYERNITEVAEPEEDDTKKTETLVMPTIEKDLNGAHILT